MVPHCLRLTRSLTRATDRPLTASRFSRFSIGYCSPKTCLPIRASNLTSSASNPLGSVAGRLAGESRPASRLLVPQLPVHGQVARVRLGRAVQPGIGIKLAQPSRGADPVEPLQRRFRLGGSCGRER
jgi:hypothetical protein